MFCEVFASISIFKSREGKNLAQDIKVIRGPHIAEGGEAIPNHAGKMFVTARVDGMPWHFPWNEKTKMREWLMDTLLDDILEVYKDKRAKESLREFITLMVGGEWEDWTVGDVKEMVIGYADGFLAAIRMMDRLYVFSDN